MRPDKDCNHPTCPFSNSRHGDFKFIASATDTKLFLLEAGHFQTRETTINCDLDIIFQTLTGQYNE